eukprot:jgi/Bigna1/87714/estExt_fgenesh1_pg.C_230121
MEGGAGPLHESKDQSKKDTTAENPTSSKPIAKEGRVQRDETKANCVAKTKCLFLIRHGTAVHNEYLLKLLKDKPNTAHKLWEEWLSQKDAVSMGFPISSTNTPLTQKGVEEATTLGKKLFEDGEPFKDASGKQYGTVWDLDLVDHCVAVIKDTANMYRDIWNKAVGEYATSIIHPFLRCSNPDKIPYQINRSTKRKIDIVALEIVKEFPQGRHYANKIDVSIDEMKQQFPHIDFKSLEDHHEKNKQENPSDTETDEMWENAFKKSKGRGESRHDLKARVDRFLKIIRTMAAEKVAVVSHSSFLHGVLCGSSKDDSVGGSLAHCQPLVFLLPS